MLNWFRVLGCRIYGLLSRRHLDEDFQQELDAHFEMLREENIRRGLPPEQARRAARLRLGGSTQLQETHRELWGLPSFETFLQDVRYGLRQLRRNPGFTAVAVITLALGIGANTAIFSVMHATLFHQLPYKNPSQLVAVWETEPDGCFSAPDFLDFKAQNRVFQDMGAFDTAEFNLTGVDNPRQIRAGSVTAGFFKVLEVHPILGRAFLAQEDQARRNHVVVLSYGLWRQRFGSDPNIVGKIVRLDLKPYTVVGVMPHDFAFSIPDHYGPMDLWVPAVLDNPSRSFHYLDVIARLKPRVTLRQARADMDTIDARLVKEYAAEIAKNGTKLVPLHEEIYGDIQPVLLLLFGAVGFVLLIACANVANLQLTRASTRQKEVAIRAALGASRGRVMRQLLSETVLLALIGGGLGILLASWGTTLLAGLQAAGLPHGTAITVDSVVLAYSLGLSVLTGVLVGLAPALHCSCAALSDSLKEGGRTTAGEAGGRRLRRVLTVFEIAISTILLIGAGLLLRSFVGLIDVKPGFDTRHILTLSLDLPQYSYPDASSQATFYTQVLTRIGSLPSVKAVGAINNLPLSGDYISGTFSIEGENQINKSNSPAAQARWVTPGYFWAMGVPLLDGRAFSAADTNTAPLVVLIDQSLARRYFPRADPIGRRVKFGPATSSHPWATVVGVVGDVRDLGLDKHPDVEIYVPYQQNIIDYNPLPEMALVVRTAGDPNSLAPAVFSEIHKVDRDLALPQALAMEAIYAASISARRFNMLLLGLFAGLALTLTAVGIYGVISYSVAQQTHEIGIRMALGAQKRDVLQLVLGQGVKLALVGAGVGLAGALSIGRVLSGLLYGVKPTDPLTFIAVSLVLIGVALLACYVPARRGAKVDPMVALRYE
jgi:predicted permease